MCFLLFLFFFSKNPLLSAGKLIFLKIKSKQKQKMDRFLTYKKAKIGPIFNFTASVYMRCRVKKLVQGLGFLALKTDPSLVLKTGPSFLLLFFPSFIVFWGIFRNTNSATVCQNSIFCKIWGCQK